MISYTNINNVNKKKHKTIILLGDHKVGKTSIITMLTKSSFNERYMKTIGVDYYTKVINEQEVTNFELLIWEANGSESTNQIISTYTYRTADLFLIMLSFDNLCTLHSLSNYLNFICEKRQHGRETKYPIDVCILINKSDIGNKEFSEKDVKRELKRHKKRNMEIRSIELITAREHDIVTQFFNNLSYFLTNNNEEINGILKIEEDNHGLNESGISLNSNKSVEKTPCC